MILNVRNWGAVSKVSIDTEKPLIIMCGPNSTGKTYASYLLYSIFSQFVRSFDCVLNYLDCSLPEDVEKEILNDGFFQLKKSHVELMLNKLSDSMKNDLISSIFAISEDVRKKLFRYFSLDIEFSECEFKNIVSEARSDSWIIGRKRIDLEKEPDSKVIRVHISQKDDNDANEISSISDIPYLEKLICSFLLSIAFGNSGYSRMLTVERNSVYTFSKELSLNRSYGKEELQTLMRPDELRSLQRYPMAITDSLMIATDLQQIQKKRGYFYEYASRLEENLLKGNIEINENGAVEFIPTTRTKTERHLPIQMTSSIVKTLSSLILYLKHLARKNDLLIIDEPEMNLHPDNQILLVRIFAELINKGLRIVISTHSDYIIREFNNMIMAKEIASKKIKLEEGESIPYTKAQMLSMKDTEVLYFIISSKTGKVDGHKVPVSEFGFDIESIDKTIKDQNETTHYLADILKYGESDE